MFVEAYYLKPAAHSLLDTLKFCDEPTAVHDDIINTINKKINHFSFMQQRDNVVNAY